MVGLVDSARVISDDAATASKRRYPLYYLFVAIVAVLVAMLVKFALTNTRFQWGVIGHYLFSDEVLRGLRLTVILTIVIFAVATVVGVFIAFARLSQFPLVRHLAISYLWFFRSVPLLVQILFWFNLGYFIPRLSIGLPFGPSIHSWSTDNLIAPITAAVIAIALHDGANVAEIVRGGILAVDRGQIDAAKSLGLRPSQIARRITLPQAARVVIPALGNQIIQTLKATALVSVVSLVDLLFTVENIYAVNLEIVPLLLVASIWYIVLVAVLSVVQSRLERRLASGYTDVARRGKAIVDKVAMGEL